MLKEKVWEMVFCFGFTYAKSRIVSANTKAMNLLQHCRRNEITATLVMMRRMKIIAPFQAKLRRERRESRKIIYL